MALATSARRLRLGRIHGSPACAARPDTAPGLRRARPTEGAALPARHRLRGAPRLSPGGLGGRDPGVGGLSRLALPGDRRGVPPVGRQRGRPHRGRPGRGRRCPSPSGHRLPRPPGSSSSSWTPSTGGGASGAALTQVASEGFEVTMGTELSDGGWQTFGHAGWTDLGTLPLWARPLDLDEVLAMRLPGQGAGGGAARGGAGPARRRRHPRRSSSPSPASRSARSAASGTRSTPCGRRWAAPIRSIARRDAAVLNHAFAAYPGSRPATAAWPSTGAGASSAGRCSASASATACPRARWSTSSPRRASPSRCSPGASGCSPGPGRGWPT